MCTAGKLASWLKRLSFDLSTASGKLMRTIMAGLPEFERDLIRDREKSSLAAARARGVKLGRRHGQRPSDKKAKRVVAMHKEEPGLPADWPQCRAFQKHRHADRKARRPIEDPQSSSPFGD
jgi:hypothetical protein